MSSLIRNRTHRPLVLLASDAIHVLLPEAVSWQTQVDPAQGDKFSGIDGLSPLATFSGRPIVSGFAQGSGTVIVEEGVAAAALVQGLMREGPVWSPVGPMSMKSYASEDDLGKDLQVAARVAGLTVVQLRALISPYVDTSGAGPVLSGYIDFRAWPGLVGPPPAGEALYEALQAAGLVTSSTLWEDLSTDDQAKWTSAAGKLGMK